MGGVRTITVTTSPHAAITGIATIGVTADTATATTGVTADTATTMETDHADEGTGVEREKDRVTCPRLSPGEMGIGVSGRVGTFESLRRRSKSRPISDISKTERNEALCSGFMRPSSGSAGDLVA